jgi:hypothetical protein
VSTCNLWSFLSKLIKRVLAWAASFPLIYRLTFNPSIPFSCKSISIKNIFQHWRREAKSEQKSSSLHKVFSLSAAWIIYRSCLMAFQVDKKERRKVGIWKTRKRRPVVQGQKDKWIEAQSFESGRMLRRIHAWSDAPLKSQMNNSLEFRALGIVSIWMSFCRYKPMKLGEPLKAVSRTSLSCFQRNHISHSSAH